MKEASTRAAPFFSRYLERTIRVKTSVKAGEPKLPVLR